MGASTTIRLRWRACGQVLERDVIVSADGTIAIPRACDGALVEVLLGAETLGRVDLRGIDRSLSERLLPPLATMSVSFVDIEAPIRAR